MARVLQNTLRDLRDLDPVNRQDTLCRIWANMQNCVTLPLHISLAECRSWQTVRSYETNRPYGHTSWDMINLDRGLYNPCFDTLIFIVEQSSYPDKRNEYDQKLNRMMRFERATLDTEVYQYHHFYNNGKTYRVLSGEWARATLSQLENIGITSQFNLIDIPRLPHYIFYRQEIAPPPWMWMLRFGNFIFDHVISHTDEDLLKRMNMRQSWDVHTPNASIILLQVPWYYPFALLFHVIKTTIGCNDLCYLILHNLYVLSIQDVSYAHSKQREEFESRWTEDDHKKNTRIRDELYDMVDGLYAYDLERPKKKRRHE